MMGERQVDQAALFYEFSLERHVPQDHLLRAIAASSTCLRFGGSWPRSTARLAVLRLIPNS